MAAIRGDKDGNMAQQSTARTDHNLDCLHITSWNINGGYTADLSKPICVSDLTASITTATPDVLGLVEVPFVNQKPSRAVDEAIQNAGLVTIGSHAFSSSHIPDSEELGMLLAVKADLWHLSSDLTVVPLGQIEARVPSKMDPHPKGLISLTIEFPHRLAVTVALTHLPPFHRFGWDETSTHNTAILEQQRLLVEAVEGLEIDRQTTKLVLMGDFNLKSRQPISQALNLKPTFEGKVTKTTSRRPADDILIDAGDHSDSPTLVPTESDHHLLTTRLDLRTRPDTSREATNDASMRALLSQALDIGRGGVDDAGCIAHPNGFRRLTFKPVGEDQSVLMLHFWTSDPRTPDAHTHRWNYESFVLAGRLLLEQLEETDDDDAPTCFKYHHMLTSEALTTHPIWCELGEAKLVTTNQQEVGAGGWYSGSWNRIHRVTCISKDAITFFRHEERSTTKTTVFSASEKMVDKGQVPRLNDDQIRQLLQTTKQQLDDWKAK